MDNKEELLKKLKIVPTLEEMGVPYRFKFYDTASANLTEAALKEGIDEGELIRTSIIKFGTTYVAILSPHNKNIVTEKLAKFIGEPSIIILPPEEANEFSKFKGDTLTPIGIDLRFYGDMSIMNSRFLAFESGVKGIFLILYKNDVITKFQVSLGYFTKDQN